MLIHVMPDFESVVHHLVNRKCLTVLYQCPAKPKTARIPKAIPHHRESVHAQCDCDGVTQSYDCGSPPKRRLAKSSHTMPIPFLPYFSYFALVSQLDRKINLHIYWGGNSVAQSFRKQNTDTQDAFFMKKLALTRTANFVYSTPLVVGHKGAPPNKLPGGKDANLLLWHGCHFAQKNTQTSYKKGSMFLRNRHKN